MCPFTNVGPVLLQVDLSNNVMKPNSVTCSFHACTQGQVDQSFSKYWITYWFSPISL